MIPPLINALAERWAAGGGSIAANPEEIAEYDAFLGEDCGPRFSGPNGGPLFMGKELVTT